jgi:uncharacterized small protein (DUF1192 family)
MSELEEVLEEIKDVKRQLEKVEREGKDFDHPVVVALHQRLTILTAERARLRSSLSGKSSNII